MKAMASLNSVEPNAPVQPLLISVLRPEKTFAELAISLMQRLPGARIEVESLEGRTLNSLDRLGEYVLSSARTCRQDCWLPSGETIPSL